MANSDLAPVKPVRRMGRGRSVPCSFPGGKTPLVTVLMAVTWEAGQLVLAVTSVQVPTFQVLPTWADQDPRNSFQAAPTAGPAQAPSAASGSLGLSERRGGCHGHTCSLFSPPPARSVPEQLQGGPGRGAQAGWASAPMFPLQCAVLLCFKDLLCFIRCFMSSV